MAWIQRLVKTYDTCTTQPALGIPPIAHTPQYAHVEIIINASGKFKSAHFIEKHERNTIIPATEDSANRTRGPAAHPLCDKLQYIARDYPTFAGKKPSQYERYYLLLHDWCSSAHDHPMAHAILKYIKRGTVVADLLKFHILATDASGKLVAWNKRSKLSRPDDLVFRNLSGESLDQGDIFIRWRVEIPGQLESAVWKDASLRKSWIAYNASQMQESALCMATGKIAPVASTHPKRIRHAKDSAKLISCNDKMGYTNRGRFTDTTGEQACTISYVASQKAHVALRWLIERQGYRNGSQVIITWSPSGAEVPDPYANPFGIEESLDSHGYNGDVGQFYAHALNKKMAGYHALIPKTTNVIIMGLDNAVPGRLAITFYREFSPAEFLKNLTFWYERTSWLQNYGKDRHFVGAPSPRDIAMAAYGDRDREKRQIRSCVERLLPCIVDARPVPTDIVSSVYHRALNRVGLEHWEWEKILGIACSLQRNYASQHQKDYSMSLETDRTDRDYLFGRLLAIADKIESFALFLANEKLRDSTAARLMQRYADHPCDTWKRIELALGPYKSRLRARRPGKLRFLESQIDEIVCLFQYNEFTSPAKLEGGFLVGYYCQRSALRARRPKENELPPSSDSEDPENNNS